MNNFSELNLPEELLKALAKMDFATPTPIQAQAIPVALKGHDILGSAQTGTGKTAAFGIPLVAHLLKNPESTAIIMTPTRELAVQVLQTLKSLCGNNSKIKTALLIGGENMFRQFSQLEDKPRIVVGTPGRINDHLNRKSLRLANADFLVLDETDRMLDMGFGAQIDKVLTHMPKERQTLMFSATLPKHIVIMSDKYMKEPVRIAVGSTSTPAKAIKQDIIRLTQGEKYATLTQQLDARSGTIIVFVRTKHGADKLAKKLTTENHSATAIHGDLRQHKRDKVLRQFREKKVRILIATDVAARGLDVPHIEHVINYDLPQCPEDYIHRIGRTARAGASGEALCLITPEENVKWIAIERLLGGKSANDAAPRQDKGKRKSFGKSFKDKGFKGRAGGQGRGRDDRKGGRSFEKRGEGRPFQKREDRPFKKREDNDSAVNHNVDARPEGRADKPFAAKRKDARPFEKRGDRPFQKRDGDRPFQKRDNKRPFVKRDDNRAEGRTEGARPEGRTDKPFAAKRDSNRPFEKRGDRPFQKRDGDRPFVKRDGDRPFQKREGAPRPEGRTNDRPFAKRTDKKEGAGFEAKGFKKPFRKEVTRLSGRPGKPGHPGGKKIWDGESSPRRKQKTGGNAR